MMDIINIVLTCIPVCNEYSVIFIMDKIRKLTGDNIIHVIKMVLLVGAGHSLYNDILWNQSMGDNGTNDYHCHSDCTVYRTDNN
ncbi:MAG: hypothetical protein ACLS9K_13560 [Lachnospira eligens]